VTGGELYNDHVIRTSPMIGLIMTNTVGTEGRGLKGGIRSITTMCCRISRLFIQMVKWIARGLQRTPLEGVRPGGHLVLTQVLTIAVILLIPSIYLMD
jgi:hypothetical protein